MKKLTITLIELSAILSDGLYHDGDSLGKELNITRSAVWKAVKKLEEYGIDIHAIKGKGYVMSEPLFLLNETLIQKEINNKNITVDVFGKIDSTNTYLKNFIGTNVSMVCIAEHQAQARGRFNRNWYSPFGKNIHLSLLFPFYKDISELAGLSIVVGLAITRSLQYLNLHKEPMLKWPNDVIYDNQKLAGTLIETTSEANGLTHAIIGIGLNVNMIKDLHNINQPWISLRQILHQYVDRNKLCTLLINNLLNSLKEFQNKGLVSFLSEWNTKDSLYNKEVTLTIGNQSVVGIARGINALGNLALEVERGHLKYFSSGDASIAKD